MKRKELKAIPVLHLERERYIFPDKVGLRQRAAAKHFYTTSCDVPKWAVPHVDLDTVGPITLQYTPMSSHMTDFRLVCIGWFVLSRPHAGSCVHVTQNTTHVMADYYYYYIYISSIVFCFVLF